MFIGNQNNIMFRNKQQNLAHTFFVIWAKIFERKLMLLII